MIAGAALAVTAVAMQSVGKVFYGAHLGDVPTALFLLVGACATAAVFLAVTRFRLPGTGLRLALVNNVWTALSFIAFFLALKYLPPATVAATEIGVSLATVNAVTSWRAHALPHWTRLAACVGIFAGCILLGGTELSRFGTGPMPMTVWLALAAGVVAGIASALTVAASRRLAMSGWNSASVLAHRFYLTIALTLVWFICAGGALPEAGTAGAILAVGTVSLLLPVLLLQFALRRTDTLTVLVCMASQPMLSFAFSMASLRYAWDVPTLAGVLIVTAFVGLDIACGNRRQGEPGG